MNRVVTDELTQVLESPTQNIYGITVNIIDINKVQLVIDDCFEFILEMSTFQLSTQDHTLHQIVTSVNSHSPQDPQGLIQYLNNEYEFFCSQTPAKENEENLQPFELNPENDNDFSDIKFIDRIKFQKDIPDDVILCILSYFPLKRLLEMRIVSRHWDGLCRHNHIWKGLCRKYLVVPPRKESKKGQSYLWWGYYVKQITEKFDKTFAPNTRCVLQDRSSYVIWGNTDSQWNAIKSRRHCRLGEKSCFGIVTSYAQTKNTEFGLGIVGAKTIDLNDPDQIKQEIKKWNGVFSYSRRGFLCNIDDYSDAIKIGICVDRTGKKSKIQFFVRDEPRSSMPFVLRQEELEGLDPNEPWHFVLYFRGNSEGCCMGAIILSNWVPSEWEPNDNETNLKF